MKRPPFVWQVQLTQDVVAHAVVELEQLPFDVLRQIVHTPLKKTIRGRDDKNYRLTVTAAQHGGIDDAVEITVHLRRGWFSQTLTHEFTVKAPTEPTTAAARASSEPTVEPIAPAAGDADPTTAPPTDNLSHG